MTTVVVRFPSEVGGLIRVARRHRGLAQSTLARALSMDASTLSRMELENVPCDLATVVRAANILRYPPLTKRAMALVQEALDGLPDVG